METLRSFDACDIRSNHHIVSTSAFRIQIAYTYRSVEAMSWEPMRSGTLTRWRTGRLRERIRAASYCTGPRYLSSQLSVSFMNSTRGTR
jgi:hypothetical protein